MNGPVPTSSRKVVVGVCGGVAAYKAAELVRELQQRGCDVRVVMTRAAQEFVRPLTFSSLTGQDVVTTLWGEEGQFATGLDEQGQIEHISQAQSADAVVIAPATAHVIAKMAHGFADDFLSTMLLATNAPVVIAPAMNVVMWNHPATQANLKVLLERGVKVVQPGSGYLACGMTGEGRLAEVATIADAVMESLASRSTRSDFSDETVLVTAGGTREAIDPVRYIGNRSSGKMGYAIAAAARRRGAQVILVSAPTALQPPSGCTVIPVVSAEEMQRAVLDELQNASILIGAAAVADFRPTNVSDQKIRRRGVLQLQLEPTADILRAAAEARKPGTLIVAFAAETDATVQKAREKLLAKGADAIVLNDVSSPEIGFDSDRNEGKFITRDQEVHIPETSKASMADQILDCVAALRTRG